MPSTLDGGKYFAELLDRLPGVRMIYEDMGLYDPAWENVTRHCLMEAARAEVLAQHLNLSRVVSSDLVFAAAIHDAYKRREVEAIGRALTKGASPFMASAKAAEEAVSVFMSYGVSSDRIEIASIVGGFPETLHRIQMILKKSNRSVNETAMLAMHYIDAYTCGDTWVSPADTHERINDIDRRISRNAENPNYIPIYQELDSYTKQYDEFKTTTTIEAERVTAHEIGVELAGGIDPLIFPEYIDKVLLEKIVSHTTL